MTKTLEELKAVRAEIQGLSLRSQALTLLNRAAALDGLLPFTTVTSNDSGEHSSIIWAQQAPTDAEVALAGEGALLANGQDWILVSAVDLSHMVGLGADCRLADALASLAEPA